MYQNILIKYNFFPYNYWDNNIIWVSTVKKKNVDIISKCEDKILRYFYDILELLSNYVHFHTSTYKSFIITVVNINVYFLSGINICIN